jgi:predicted PurR-regulated permease PerM
VIAGSVPALLITAGLESFGRAGVLLAIIVGLQLVHIWVTQPQVVERSRLYVGPLVLITSITLGYRVYGTGGALYGSALAVLGVAILNAAGEDREPVESTATEASAVP